MGNPGKNMNSNVKILCLIAIILSGIIVTRTQAASAVLDKNFANWSDPTAWTTGAVPGSSDSAFIRNNDIVTIDTNVGSVNNFFIGDTSATGTVNVAYGGKLISLSTTTLSTVGRSNANGAIGYLNLRGGTLLMGASGANVLQIGLDGKSGTTINHSTGILTLKNGTFTGRLIVGSDVAGDSGDIVYIEGSGATIGSTSTLTNGLEVHASGSLQFIFDSAGISSMNFSGPAAFFAGSSIQVDGTAYTGGAKTFTLLTAKTLGTVTPVISLTNFAAGTSYNWDTTHNVLTVSVSGPSPVLPVSNLPGTVYIYNQVNTPSTTTSVDEMMTSVAGLANRYYPGQMYPALSGSWLNWLTAAYPGVQQDSSHANDYAWFIDRYSSIFKGYILYDKSVSADSLDVASSLAGLYDAIIVDPSTVSYATDAGLPMIMDVRSQTQGWAWSNYSASFNKNKMFHEGTIVNGTSARLTGFDLRDYATMCQGFSFYLPNNIGNYLPGQNECGLFTDGAMNRVFSAPPAKTTSREPPRTF